jgi:hypothetical protein
MLFISVRKNIFLEIICCIKSSFKVEIFIPFLRNFTKSLCKFSFDRVNLSGNPFVHEHTACHGFDTLIAPLLLYAN